ncbi:hypothetical protein [Xenorhabdus mauleonii]|nr:hypothetical protein [Xenorhabdus mauleonii]
MSRYASSCWRKVVNRELCGFVIGFSFLSWGVWQDGLSFRGLPEQ